MAEKHPSDTLEVDKKYERIPDYIMDQRNQEQPKSRMQTFQKEMVPISCRTLHETERIAILRDLYEVHAELQLALDTFPNHKLNSNRSSLINRQKEDLEIKFHRVSAAIEFYQKPPV